MKNKTQKITTKGMVYRDGKVLMVFDQGGNWELPGGRIDFGETPEETLKREFFEELKVSDVHVRDIINVWTFTVEGDAEDRQYVVLVYECFANLDAISISDEHSRHKWMGEEELDRMPMREGYKVSLKKFFAVKKGLPAR